jgi:hypothetical protein
MAPLAPGKLAAIKAQKAKEDAGKEMSSPARVSPPLKKSKKKKDVGTSAGPQDTHKSPPRPPRSIRLTPPPTSSFALPADNWRVVLATNDYGGEQNSAWDLKFSGGNIVSQYTSSSDRERIGSLSYEEALEASRTYALQSAAIVTEVGKSFASERAEFQSSLTAARVSLAQAEHKMRGMEASIDIYAEEEGKYKEDLHNAREECQTFREKCSQLEEEKKSRELVHGKKIKELEYNALDCYEDGFGNAIKQTLMFYPDLDLSHVDSGKRVQGGRLVITEVDEPFGIVTGPHDRSH